MIELQPHNSWGPTLPSQPGFPAPDPTTLGKADQGAHSERDQIGRGLTSPLRPLGRRREVALAAVCTLGAGSGASVSESWWGCVHAEVLEQRA